MRGGRRCTFKSQCDGKGHWGLRRGDRERGGKSDSGEGSEMRGKGGKEGGKVMGKESLGGVRFRSGEGGELRANMT